MEKTACSEPVLRSKAARYCATAERCEQEVTEKLRAWGANEQEIIHIVDYLTENDYLNNSRYCEAFVHDKVAYQGWGRQKIRYALRQKGLPDRHIETALREIDERTYYNQLQRLISSRPTPKTEQDKQRLVRFLLQRGFVWEEIRTYC